MTKAVGLVLTLLVIRVALVLLAVWMLVWNITDMQNVGINFWNMFWTVLAVSCILRGNSGVAD